MTSWTFLFISVAFHILLWYAVLSHQKSQPLNPPVEVQIVERPRQQKDARQVVRQATPPRDLLTARASEKAKYLSEHDQFVKKQMQSKLSGLTKNTTNQNNIKTPTQAPQEARRNEPAEDIDGIRPPRSHKRLTDLSQTLPPGGASTSSEVLDDVQEGPVTALNTERLVYYSFFAPIEERVRPLWERNLGETKDRLSQEEAKRMSNRAWITQLEILLDPKGQYVGTNVLESSGIQELDRDAILAFQQAKFFPNPPTALIKQDGLIHLQFSLRFYLSDSVWARRSSE